MTKNKSDPSRLSPSQRRDAAIRDRPEGYVDPARYRARKHRPKVTKIKKHIIPPFQQPSDATAVVESEPYPRHMRLGIMLVAIQDGVPSTAQQFDIPERTIYGWFAQEGGLTAVREYAQSAAENSFTKLIQKACDELYSRMEDASDDELFASFRKMLDTAEGAGLTGVRSAKKRRGESESSPEHPPGTQPHITLQFVPPAPAIDSPKTKVTVEEEEEVEGEVTDVFDE